MKNETCFGLENFGSFWKHFKKKLGKLVPEHLSFVTNWKDAVDQTHRVDFLEDFFPIDILPWNISSNDGLSKSFSELRRICSNSFFNRRRILKVIVCIFF